MVILRTWMEDVKLTEGQFLQQRLDCAWRSQACGGGSEHDSNTPPPYFNLNPYISVDGPVESMKLEWEELSGQGLWGEKKTKPVKVLTGLGWYH